MKRKSPPKETDAREEQNPFRVPKAQPSREKEMDEIVSGILASGSSAHEEQPLSGDDLPDEYLKALVSIATNAWRARAKMVDGVTGEFRDEHRRAGRHIEAIYRNLGEVGIVIRDHTNEPYDEGQPMKVIASKMMPALDKKRVSETLLPSVFWKDYLVQNGEIEIAIPGSTDGAVELEPSSP